MSEMRKIDQMMRSNWPAAQSMMQLYTFIMNVSFEEDAL